jgi:hypothetical protein
MNITAAEMSGVCVLVEHGFVTLEIKKPDGCWIRSVYTFDPHPRELSVKEIRHHYSPEGIPVEDLIPDSIEENQAKIALSALKIKQHLSEVEAELENIVRIVTENIAVTDATERAAAGMA